MEKTTKIENGGYYQFEICSDRLIFLPMDHGADFFLDTIKIELGGSSMNFCALFWRIILIRK